MFRGSPKATMPLFTINSYLFLLLTCIHACVVSMERPLKGPDSPYSSIHSDDSDELARTWAASSSNSDLSSPSIADELQQTEIAKDLHGACKNGNLDAVRLLLNAHRDRINELDTSGSSLLQLAVCNEREYTLLVEFLLERGAALDFPGLVVPLLVEAVSRGHNNIAKLLLARGANSNSVGIKKSTALHLAAENGSDELVQLLINKGAAVLALDNDTRIPFQIARQHGRTSIMQILMRATENLPSSQPASWSPLKTSRAEPPLTNKELFFKSSQTGDVPAIQTLLEQHKVTIKTTDDAGLTALHKAALAGQTEVVRELLAQNLAADTKTRAQSTALHYSVRSGHLATARLLLEHGASVSAHDKWGDTPLQAAGFNAEKIVKYHELIKLLARHGADISKTATKHLFSKQPLTSAILFNDETKAAQSIKQFMDNSHRSDVQDLHEALTCAAARGYGQAVQRLLPVLRRQPIIWERIQEALVLASQNLHHPCAAEIARFILEHSQSIPVAIRRDLETLL